MAGGAAKGTLASRGLRWRMCTAVRAASAGAAVLVLAACSISVPSQEQPGATSSAPTTFAAPTTQAGHDAAAVAAANMTFAAGGALSPGEPVDFADALAQDAYGASAPPEWTAAANAAAGQRKYTSAAGCTLAYWATTNQGPLVVAGDDLASTQALFHYLAPSVVESSLKPATFAWSKDPGQPAPTIDFLSYRSVGPASASMVWGRMLGAAQMGLLVSLSCPTEAALVAATASASAKLSVVPPSR